MERPQLTADIFEAFTVDDYTRAYLLGFTLAGIFARPFRLNRLDFEDGTFGYVVTVLEFDGTELFYRHSATAETPPQLRCTDNVVPLRPGAMNT